MKSNSLPHSVEVITTARLHMGFFDLNGSIGRRFGSMGVSLQTPHTHIEVSTGKGELADDYIERTKHILLQHAGIQTPVHIRVIEQIPRHAGLGSGTQMALAVGAGISALFNLNLPLRDIAGLIGRGARSGIGIGTFATGGVVLDAGSNANTIVPPIIAQHAFPEAWRILLVFDPQYTGVHGDAELQAFRQLADHDLLNTQQLSHQLLMQALPALAEQDLATFGKAVSALQAYNGDYFAPVQGGRYASSRVTAVLNDLITHGVDGVGQSSWGPTGFAIFANQQEAEAHHSRLQSRFADAGLTWKICAANNSGAQVNIRNKG